MIIDAADLFGITVILGCILRILWLLAISIREELQRRESLKVPKEERVRDLLNELSLERSSLLKYFYDERTDSVFLLHKLKDGSFIFRERRVEFNSWGFPRYVNHYMSLDWTNKTFSKFFDAEDYFKIIVKVRCAMK